MWWIGIVPSILDFKETKQEKLKTQEWNYIVETVKNSNIWDGIFKQHKT